MLGNRRNLAGDLRLSITPAGDGEHVGFVQAADRSERAGRVAVQRGIPHHGLALVARVHQHPAVCVRQRHEAHHAAARLRVLGRQTPRARRRHARGQRGARTPRYGSADGDGAAPGCPRLRASSRASSTEWSAEYGPGSSTPCTRSAPSASAHITATDAGVHAARQPDEHVGEPSVVRDSLCSALARRGGTARYSPRLPLPPSSSRRSTNVCAKRQGARDRPVSPACAARSASPFREACFRT